MEKEIIIDITNSNELLEKYNKNKVCKDVIEYLVKEAMILDNEAKIKIIVHKDSELLDFDCKELIKNGLKDEYKRNITKHHDNNIKQIYFLILGVLIIYISSFFKGQALLREIILIIGWVPIWEMARIELIPDVQGRIKRKILKKLIYNSEISEIIK